MSQASRYASMTEEQRERERERKRVASMTEEQRERKRERAREYERQRRASMTEEHREYERQRRASMTEEQRERRRSRQRVASMTEEQRERRRSRQRVASMTEEQRERQRERQRRSQGIHITNEQWSAMFEAQGRRCAICRSDSPRTKYSWHTDHCHETGRVRGVLCSSCNVGLGAFRDEIVTMENAIHYLRTHRACGHLTCETAPAGKCLLESGE